MQVWANMARYVRCKNMVHILSPRVATADMGYFPSKYQNIFFPQCTVSQNNDECVKIKPNLTISAWNWQKLQYAIFCIFPPKIFSCPLPPKSCCYHHWKAPQGYAANMVYHWPHIKCKMWYMNGSIFQNLRKFEKKAGKVSSKFYQKLGGLVGMWMGHLFLEDWYLYGPLSSKIPSGTSLPTLPMLGVHHLISRGRAWKFFLRKNPSPAKKKKKITNLRRKKKKKNFTAKDSEEKNFNPTPKFGGEMVIFELKKKSPSYETKTKQNQKQNEKKLHPSEE